MYEVTYMENMKDKRKQFESEADLAVWLNLFGTHYNITEGDYVKTVKDPDGEVLLDTENE